MYHYSMEVSDYYSATKDHFAVEDLFNFNDEEANNNNNEDNTTAFEGIHVNSSSSSIIATDASSGSSVSAHQQHFSTDFSEPVEEVAELEWLSNFMEDCFSNKDSHHHHHYHQHHYQSQDPTHYSSTSSAVLAKARSKRSRANPGSWAARIPILPTQEDIQEQVQNVIATCQEGSGRRCLHCGSDKTPQWRMGPMGPKTLCNACGVRYKSGRLVPEYRPAASPTFVVSEHSNSHRKVVELRRQKEMQKQQKQHQSMLFWSQ